jgi:hypothetical protein
MAAVLCLVFLPALAAIGFMFGTVSGEHSVAGVFVALTFCALGFGIFLGMLKMAKGWEGPESHH